MTTAKTFLCRCEDITVDDCTEAIDGGYTCFEDLKRFLGVGTGPCQGKSCVQAAMHLIAESEAIPVADVDVMTFRPPVRPIAFEVLAADGPGERDGPGHSIDPADRGSAGRGGGGTARNRPTGGPDAGTRGGATAHTKEPSS